MTKYVYSFGDGVAEGGAGMEALLGKKGAYLAEMTNLGIPVPPGFTISTKACAQLYQNERKPSKELKAEIAEQLSRLEELTGKRVGDVENPLFLSVRSSAVMPKPAAIVDAVLNLGVSDKTMPFLEKIYGNPRFAWDVYRRFIKKYGTVVLNIPEEPFEIMFANQKAAGNITRESGFDAQFFAELTDDYKKIIKNYQKSIPQKPAEQLWNTMSAVFSSWMHGYKNPYPADGLAGAAIIIQMMVFGNLNGNSGSGVCFSRDPSTGENKLYGEYLMNAQGEDVAAGARTPEKIARLAKQNPDIYQRLFTVRDILEKHFQDMQDMEFTFQDGIFYLLQTRSARRSGQAAIKCALDMVQEGLIDKKTAIQRITPEDIVRSMRPQLNLKPKGQRLAKPLTSGFNAAPGAVSGRIAFSVETAKKWHTAGKPVVLVQKSINPHDITGLMLSQGLIVSTGGVTGYAATLARDRGIPCISGANTVTIQGKKVVIGPKRFKEGEWISIDGLTGSIFAQELPFEPSCLTDDGLSVLDWCDVIRSEATRPDAAGFPVYGTVDTPQDIREALEQGATGIGLYRTDALFTDKKTMGLFQKFFLAAAAQKRIKILKRILPLQKKVFTDVFTGLKGKPAALGLFEKPLRELLPHTRAEINQLAKKRHISNTALKHTIDALCNLNLPSCGYSGQLAVTFPELYDMQVEALVLAAAECAHKNIPVQLDMVMPVVISAHETALFRSRIEAVVAQTAKEAAFTASFRIGVMIKTPCDALLAGEFAKNADFFCFETRELTRTTLALSEKDANALISAKAAAGNTNRNPFLSLGKAVGKLMQYAIAEGRAVKPGLWVSVCGKHSSDPASIDFYYHAGLNVVSCEPDKIPVARLAGAHAILYDTE